MNYFVNTKVAEGALPASVLELLGLPDGARLERDSAAAFSWMFEEDGDGIGIARSAFRSGLEGQIQQLLNLASRGKKLRRLIVAPSLCGNRRFHERPDLLAVDDAVKSGWCRFVAATDLSRISREAAAGTLFVEYLREEGVELILTSWSSEPVDLHPLSLEMQLLNLIPASEYERLRAAFRRLSRPAS
jgi:hypothetical protein